MTDRKWTTEEPTISGWYWVYGSFNYSDEGKDKRFGYIESYFPGGIDMDFAIDLHITHYYGPIDIGLPPPGP